MKKLLLILLVFSGCTCKNQDKEAVKAFRHLKNYVDSINHEAKKEVPDYKPKDSL